MTIPSRRRERKKARTRAEISEAAMRLFVAQGYDAVTLAQVADAADVSVTTLFKYFPRGKESLIFEEDQTRASELRSALRDRPLNQSVLDALYDFWRDSRRRRVDEREAFQGFQELVSQTPALRDYGRRLWADLKPLLAVELAQERHLAADHPDILVLAHLAVEVLLWAQHQPNLEDMHDIFRRLELGWPPRAPNHS